MIVVEIEKDGEALAHIELPAVPSIGDTVIVGGDLDGIVENIVWQPNNPPIVVLQ